jgi:uncharacterized protein YkwD
MFKNRFKPKVLVLTILLWIASTGTLPGHAIAVSGQNVVSLTNAERTALSLPALAWNPALANSAWL